MSSLKLLVYRRILSPGRNIYYRLKWNIQLAITLLLKRCYFGPFTGELGHLLGHNLPFVSYLHSKGVKVHFCGMEIHRPFFIDDKGAPIVSSYLALRDFFSENAPTCNTSSGLPEDVRIITDRFTRKARRSIFPYWDNSDKDLYFYHFRWWILKYGLAKAYDLSKVYSKQKERTVVIFPRKWNPNFPEKIDDQRLNNGLNWDYYQVAKCVSPYFEKVYVLGHPVFTNVGFSSFDNVEVIIGNDNRLILEKCSSAGLIISQHSGTVYLGEYTNSQVLIIYSGGRKVGDIGITTAFKNSLGRRYDFNFAFSLGEIEDYVRQFRSAVPGAYDSLSKTAVR